MKKYHRLTSIVLLLLLFVTVSYSDGRNAGKKIQVLFDTDANNELDDQHAMAYLFFNSDLFNVVGVTVNTTYNGGNIDKQYEEAKRVMQLCNVYRRIPLLKGADGSFAGIKNKVRQNSFDGSEAVNFIIRQARKAGPEKLVLLPVGKLTNIALALAKEPSIASRVRIVWLGSNYPEPGEYNQDNDTTALNYILNKNVPFEIVTVRYGKTSGTSAVTATRQEVAEKMPGLGPKAAQPVTGRHGGSFASFGDYSIDLFKHIDTHDEAGTRALYDMAAVAIVKNPTWAEKRTIPAPLLRNNTWQERPENKRTIVIWENFNKEAIMNDFYDRMKNYSLPERKKVKA
jgi:inosine-uridine nucleoside N-ribohydrolase